MIALEECEGVLGRRGASETDAISTEIVQTFLAEWDGLDKDSQVWVIGTTNRRDLVDEGILSRFGWEIELKHPAAEDRKSILPHLETINPAILSRFSEKLVIPLPDRQSRMRLFSIFLNYKQLNFPLEDGAVLLADLAEGRNWGGRDLENWVRSAEQKALMRAVRDGGPEHYSISLEDFDLLEQ